MSAALHARMHPTAVLFLIAAANASTPTPPAAPLAAPPAAPSYVETMKSDAPRALATVHSPWVKAVFARVDTLRSKPAVAIYRDKERDLWLDDARFAALPAAEQARFTRELWEDDRYYAKWSSPLAWVRALDLAAQHGLDGLARKKVVDYGYGDIAHLQLFALAGAHAVGVDPHGALPILYAKKDDTGAFGPGTVTLVHDRFPETDAARAGVGNGIDVFLSKNTLKMGYVHPKHAVDPKKTLNLSISDAVFLKRLHDALNPKGLVVLYNLAPAPSKAGEPYKHWAEGQTPFSRAQWAEAGFDVLVFDADDTVAARQMARALGWDAGEEKMDLETDLFAWVTIARKR